MSSSSEEQQLQEELAKDPSNTTSPEKKETSTAVEEEEAESPSDVPTLEVTETKGTPTNSKPAPFSWGKPAPSAPTPDATTNNYNDAPRKPAGLAEIMAEEAETRLAAQAVYSDAMTLAEMEAEQERLIREFQERKQSSSQMSSEAAARSTFRNLGTVDRAFSQRALDEIEQTEAVVDNPHNSSEEERRRQCALIASNRAPPMIWIEQELTGTHDTTVASPIALPEEAKAHLTEQEILEIEQALREAELGSGGGEETIRIPAPAPAVASLTAESDHILSEDEAVAIAAALREADAKQEEESLLLALQIQQLELSQLQSTTPSLRPQGNVRTMTRAELDHESQRVAELYTGGGSSNGLRVAGRASAGQSSLQLLEQENLRRASAPGAVSDGRVPPRHHPLEDDDDEDHEHFGESAGFRMNSASAAHEWARRDRNTIIGPNNEIRTKHDIHVQGQANAQYLGLDEDDFGVRTHVGNQAFNAFKKTMKRTIKGVASHGTGRAGTDSDAVRGKAMDPHVRLQISKAINSGLIEHCNGAVKQGKEAVVYHAIQGAESQGHDVAVKVFKRITEFRGRGSYVDGDPRYARENFRKKSEREQLELWAEKEFRNLVRANRAKVPVPTPLHYKENIIFMRFLGNDGWPAPQIREIDMRKGSAKWDLLYTQVLEAIRRLYVKARLVHGDLSEYNILVAPSFQVENLVSSVDDSDSDLQAVLIDFGQAVEVRHPDATDLLLRDLDRVRTFFVKQGVTTLAVQDSLLFVTDQIGNGDGAEMQASTKASNTVEARS